MMTMTTTTSTMVMPRVFRTVIRSSTHELS